MVRVHFFTRRPPFGYGKTFFDTAGRWVSQQHDHLSRTCVPVLWCASLHAGGEHARWLCSPASVLPSNCESAADVRSHCEASLQRLGLTKMYASWAATSLPLPLPPPAHVILHNTFYKLARGLFPHLCFVPIFFFRSLYQVHCEHPSASPSSSIHSSRTRPFATALF